jgi:hypothetical protein
MLAQRLADCRRPINRLDRVRDALQSAACPLARSEIDALKARLLGLVNRRDDSNEPPEVKEEKARALLERYHRDVAEA